MRPGLRCLAPPTRNHANRRPKHSLLDDLEPVGWWLRPPGTRSAAGRASARCARRMLRELQIRITSRDALPGADRRAPKRSMSKGWDEDSCPRAAKNAAAWNLVYLAPSHRAESTRCAHPPTTITGRLRGRVAHKAVTQLTAIPRCGRHTRTDRWQVGRGRQGALAAMRWGCAGPVPATSVRSGGVAKLPSPS